jgi:hypothetical protein
MRGLVFLFQLLFWLVIIRILVRGFARVFPRPVSPSPQAGQSAEDLVLDRVCRTHLPRARAIAARVAGREEYFCCAACRDKALAAVAHAS